MRTNLIACTDYRNEYQLFVINNVNIAPNVGDIVEYEGRRYIVVERMFKYNKEFVDRVDECWIKVKHY